MDPKNDADKAPEAADDAADTAASAAELTAQDAAAADAAGEQAQPDLSQAIDAVAADGGISRAEVEQLKAAVSGRMANARTAARTPSVPKVKPGARQLRNKPAEQAPAAPTRRGKVYLVLQTSRLMGSHGRPVPRRSVVACAPERAEQLVLERLARSASRDEVDAAAKIFKLI